MFAKIFTYNLCHAERVLPEKTDTPNLVKVLLARHTTLARTG